MQLSQRAAHHGAAADVAQRVPIQSWYRLASSACATQLSAQSVSRMLKIDAERRQNG